MAFVTEKRNLYKILIEKYEEWKFKYVRFKVWHGIWSRFGL